MPLVHHGAVTAMAMALQPPEGFAMSLQGVIFQRALLLVLDTACPRVLDTACPGRLVMRKAAQHGRAELTQHDEAVSD